MSLNICTSQHGTGNVRGCDQSEIPPRAAISCRSKVHAMTTGIPCSPASLRNRIDPMPASRQIFAHGGRMRRRALTTA